MAKLVAVRLSNNPERTSDVAIGGIDGKASVSTGGHKYVVLEFVDDQNIFKFSRSIRPYWMKNEEQWNGATPEQLKAYEGKVVPGKFSTLRVAEYEIQNEDGTVNKAQQYTTFVMPHENELTVFAQAGHTVLDGEGNVLIEAVRKAEAIA